MDTMDVSTQPVLNTADTAEVLKHIGGFCARTLQLEIITLASDGYFISKPAGSGRQGILEFKGEINDTGQLHITMLLSRWPAHLPVPVDEIWNRLAGLNSRIRLLPARKEAGLESAYHPVREVLDPLLPLPADLYQTAAGLQVLFQDLADFLSAGVTIALASLHETEQSFALSGLSRALLDRGSSLG